MLALGALHRYSFKRLLIADLLIAATLAAARALQPAARRRRRGAPGLAACIPLALALIGGWRFLPPSEYIIGGKDPGVYVNEGIQIAQRGAIVVRDPVVASVPGVRARPVLSRATGQPRALRRRRASWGSTFVDPDRGAVVGQFPARVPGVDRDRPRPRRTDRRAAAVAFWGVLGVLSVYFFGARLLGRPAAAAAATLLALNVVQVWFARYPNADIVMQALLFAALLANARAHVDDDRVLRAGRGHAARRCCSSCGSTPSSRSAP